MREVLRVQEHSESMRIEYTDGTIETIPCHTDKESTLAALANHSFQKGYEYALRVGTHPSWDCGSYAD